MNEGGIGQPDPIMKERKVADIGAPSPAFQIIGLTKAINEAQPVRFTLDDSNPSFLGNRLYNPSKRQRQ